MRRQSRGWHEALTVSTKAVGLSLDRFSVWTVFAVDPAGTRACMATHGQRCASHRGPRPGQRCMTREACELERPLDASAATNAGDGRTPAYQPPGMNRERWPMIMSESDHAAAANWSKPAKRAEVRGRRSRSTSIVAIEKWRTDSEGSHGVAKGGACK